MAAAAQVVKCGGGEALRVADRLRRFRVTGAGAMTALALNPSLVRLDFESGAELKRPSRVTLEAAENCSVGIESAIALPVPDSMSWSEPQ